MSRITEDQLILPSLYLMNSADNKTISITELKNNLIAIFKPTGEDAKQLKGRKDNIFTQQVRNLKSHNTFENLGLAVYHSKEKGERSGSFRITNHGKKYLAENITIVNYLLNNHFDSQELKDAFGKAHINRNKPQEIEIFDENLLIYEGMENITSSKKYKRSKLLRDKAIKHFTDENGRIKCKVCDFDFEEFYGEHGKAYIEIHHQKPVFQFDGDDMKQTITQALKNLIPVCANCHRMIHRSRENSLSCDDMKKIVKDDK
ncbi:MAG: HNH endonuclease [Campylobacterota bacterium]|nr:HNH endonuclease [Campylobacterota bacterium]